MVIRFPATGNRIPLQCASTGRKIAPKCPGIWEMSARGGTFMISLKRGNINFLLCLLFALTATPVYADPIIFQSALLGPTGQNGGAVISSNQFLGPQFL